MLWSKGLSRVHGLFDWWDLLDTVCCAIRLHALSVGLEFVWLSYLASCYSTDHEKVFANLVLCYPNTSYNIYSAKVHK